MLIDEKVSVEILTTHWSFTPHGIILGASHNFFFFSLDQCTVIQVQENRTPIIDNTQELRKMHVPLLH